MGREGRNISRGQGLAAMGKGWGRGSQAPGHPPNKCLETPDREMLRKGPGYSGPGYSSRIHLNSGNEGDGDSSSSSLKMFHVPAATQVGLGKCQGEGAAAATPWTPRATHGPWGERVLQGGRLRWKLPIGWGTGWPGKQGERQSESGQGECIPYRSKLLPKP